MARDKALPQNVYTAAVEMLRAAIDGCTDANCFFCLDPDCIPPTPGEFFYVVAPTSGTFDEGMIDGGGIEQLTVEAGLLVKIHSPLMLDQVGRDVELLNNESLGLWSKATEVMAALAVQSPTVAGNPQTRDPLMPHSFSITKSLKRLGAIELTFKVLFDWDVSGA